MAVSPDTPATQGLPERRAIKSDALIAAAVFATIVVMLISVDFFEFIYYFTRDHEEWEVDEFLAAVPAGAAAMAWFAYRRWRQSIRLLEELREAIEQRGRMEDQLQNSQRVAALGELAAGLAHEINNTLQPVFVLAGLCLDDDGLSDRNAKRIEKIISAAERGRDISRKALHYARAQDGDEDVEPVVLSQAIAEIVAFLDEATYATLKIKTEIRSDSGTARIPATELMQVFTNLIGNAADAMGAAGVVRVRYDRLTDVTGGKSFDGADSGAYARISVSDEGSGMSNDVMKRVFDPFFSTKRPGQGTGLGLSVVYGIVEKWGGKISVESEEGVGTVFHILVPIDSNKASERSDPHE